MLTFRSLALLAAATLVAGQTLDPSLGDCALACYNTVKAQSGSWPTPCPADEMTCICKAAQFKDGVHDCSAQCPGGVDFAGTVLADLNKICDAVLVPAPGVGVTSTPPAPAPGATSASGELLIPAPTPSASTSLAPTSQPPGPTTTSETSATSAATGAAVTSTSSEEAAGAKPTESTTPATSTSNAENTSSSSPEATHSNEPAGLTTAGKAGIGIGATAAVAALAGLAFWLVVVQRRNKRANGFSSKHMIKISDPAPGGGRSFAGDHHYETGLSELEMKSRRYEDMIPRQQPRHMV